MITHDRLTVSSHHTVAPPITIAYRSHHHTVAAGGSYTLRLITPEERDCDENRRLRLSSRSTTKQSTSSA
jgi:hypothetical protein